MKQSFISFFLSVSLLSLFLISCGKNSGADKREPESADTNQSVSAAPKKDAVVPVPIVFPQDEAAHWEHPIEWWYLNAHLTDASGREYAFFFCILTTGRHLVSLYDKSADTVVTKDYYESVQAAQNKKSISSASLQWQQEGAPFRYRLSYAFEELSANLTMKSNKKPFLPEGNGFIKMGENGASYYYSLTDLTVEGIIDMGTSPTAVKGRGWLDHQWGLWNWTEDFSQWKWYAVKLDNGTDLMLFNIYKNKKLINSYCGYMDAGGNQFHKLACELVTKKYYEDDLGGKWQKVVELKIPALANTVLTLTSERDLQFIEPNVLWEGSMKVKGTFKGAPAKGIAYGELNRPD